MRKGKSNYAISINFITLAILSFICVQLVSGQNNRSFSGKKRNFFNLSNQTPSVVSTNQQSNNISFDSLSSTLWSDPKNFTVVGEFVYLHFSNGLKTINVSDPLNPYIENELKLNGTNIMYGINSFYSNDYLFITDGTLKILDISSQTTPVLV